MSKREIVEFIHHSANLKTKAEAERTLESILDGITDSLVRGEGISLRGFGSFKVKTVAERMGRDFKTGKGVLIPARKSVKFDPGTELKESVRIGKAASFLDSMETRITDIKKSIEDLGSKEQIEKLRQSYDESRYKLTLLQNAGEGAWTELKGGFDSAFKQLRTAFTKAKDKF